MLRSHWGPRKLNMATSILFIFQLCRIFRVHHVSFSCVFIIMVYIQKKNWGLLWPFTDFPCSPAVRFDCYSFVVRNLLLIVVWFYCRYLHSWELDAALDVLTMCSCHLIESDPIKKEVSDQNSSLLFETIYCGHNWFQLYQMLICMCLLIN